MDCDVTNNGWSPANVTLVLTLRRAIPGYADADGDAAVEPFGSLATLKVGRVWPGKTSTITNSAPFAISPTMYCVGKGLRPGQDWRAMCRLDVSH